MPRKSFLIALGLCIIFSAKLQAITYVVISDADSGPGTLRDAILLSNVSPGPDDIIFAIPGVGVQTIFPATQLPPLTDATTIDGTTQPGASCGASPPSTAVLMIEIDGSSAGAAHGLWLKSHANSVKGLIINNFEQDGIRIEGDPDGNANLITCCFIGTDSTGMIDAGNGTSGVGLWAGVKIQNQPNGTATFNTVERNLISGNYAEGVWIEGPFAPGDVGTNYVTFNYIGTDKTGMGALGNDRVGVEMSEGTHHNNVQLNVISGNGWDGVGMQGFDNAAFADPPLYTRGNLIAENVIGLAVDSVTPMGNGNHGIAIGEYGPSRPETFEWGFADSNIISANYIAYNGGDGVAVWEHGFNNFNADANVIISNIMHDNGGLGIDLQNNGVTLNDSGDPDDRANQEMNFPIITGASYVAPTTTVTGTTTLMTLGVEVFITATDPSGYGEGFTLLGVATNDGLGGWELITNLLTAGDEITATATDSGLNTSEFSENFIVTTGSNPWDCTFNPPPNKNGTGPEVEPNDVCGDATQTACETSNCGDISDPATSDWWTVTLSADTCSCLHVRVFADDTPGQYALGGGLDPVLKIYDSDCSTLLFQNNDHNGTFPDAESSDAQYDCQDLDNCYEPGKTLYIEVSSELSTTGPYLLVINCDVCECPDPPADTCLGQWPGDVNGGGSIDINDVTYLSNYIYLSGPAPTPLANGDVDGDCDIDVKDLNDLTSFISTGSPIPVTCTCVNPSTFCCLVDRGNANFDILDKANVADVSYLTAWLFGIPSGPGPRCWEEANANSDPLRKVNVSDVSYLVDWLFGIPTGPAPGPCPY